MDFQLHDAGAFDSVTATWVHAMLVVTPGSMVTYKAGLAR